MIDPYANLNMMPLELLKRIFEKDRMPAKDLGRIACVSKRMYEVIKNLEAWRWLFISDYNQRYCIYYSGLPQGQLFYELYGIEVRANKDFQLEKLDAISKDVREINEALLLSVTVMNPVVAPRIFSFFTAAGRHLHWLFQKGTEQSRAVDIISQTAHSIFEDA